MNMVLLGMLLVLGILVGMTCMVEIGRRLGARRMARDPEGAKAGAGAVETAVFGLMGLLIAFTFTAAASRFDTRREQLVEEANCIGTAWLRLALLPAKAQPPLRDKLRQYTDARLTAFNKMPDVEAAQIELNRANLLQNEIWAQAVEACRGSGEPSTTMLLLPALNQMFDMATTRTMGTKMHPPLVIYLTLGLLLLASSLVAGYHMGEGKWRSWVHTIVFVAVIALAFYVILDFEFPRMGLIRIHSFDQVLVDVRQSMK
jgi:hypothetical protein